MNGANPIRTSVSAKLLSGPATTRSQAATMPMPPARTLPSICAITGFGISTSLRSTSIMTRVRSSAATAGSPSLASSRSAPAQKVLPVCASTIARTLSSPLASSSPRSSSATSLDDSALRLCGESSVSVATPFATA